MILPQDTKEPLVDSDTELDFDVEEDDYVPPYSPRSACDSLPPTHPCFRNDELNPPPYSSGANTEIEDDWKRPPTSLRKELEKRRTRILWSCLAIVALYTTFIVFATHHRYSHRRFRPSRPLSSAEDDDHFELGGVVGTNCAVFKHGSPTYRGHLSSNATFLLSTSASELYDQYRGDAVVGNIFVSVYDPDTDQIDDGAIYHGDRPKAGEYVRIKVEALYDDDANGDSAGWDMLQASKVCLVARPLEPHPGLGRSLRSHGHRLGASSLGTASALGVDLYSEQPPNHNRLPLHFRLHVQLPRSASSASEAVDEVEERSTRSERSSKVPPLLLQGTAGNVHAELDGVLLSTLRLRTEAGSISVDDAEADVLQLRSHSGRVAGSITAAKLDVKTDAGNIDLQLSLPASSSSPSTRENEKCSHVEASLYTKSGNIALRHGDWPVCHVLREHVITGAGNVNIATHPRFEGDFRIETKVGSIHVEDSKPEDPEGQGRSRVIRKKESGRWGPRSVKGDVAWGEDKGDSELIAETKVGTVKVVF